MTETITVQEEREPLFPLFCQDEDEAVKELIDTRRSFQAIAYYRGIASQAAEDMRKHLEMVQAEMDAIQEFYTKKALAAQGREEFHATNLGNFITANGLKKVATPYGTAFFRSHTRRTWPSDELTLIDFAKAEGVADKCLQTKLSPKKAELLKYIHATGVIPEGFLEEEVTDVQVRLRNEPAQEVA